MSQHRYVDNRTVLITDLVYESIELFRVVDLDNLYLVLVTFIASLFVSTAHWYALPVGSLQGSLTLQPLIN